MYNIVHSHYSKSNDFGDIEYCEENDSPTHIEVWVAIYGDDGDILNANEALEFTIEDEGLACAKIQELKAKYNCEIEHY